MSTPRQNRYDVFLDEGGEVRLLATVRAYDQRLAVQRAALQVRHEDARFGLSRAGKVSIVLPATEGNATITMTVAEMLASPASD